jgi:hypothetical protein
MTEEESKTLIFCLLIFILGLLVGLIICIRRKKNNDNNQDELLLIEDVSLEKFEGRSTSKDSECDLNILTGKCEADGDHDDSSCTKYMGVCYTNNPNVQCTSDSQCVRSWTGECVNNTDGSDLYCRNSIVGCVCTQEHGSKRNVSPSDPLVLGRVVEAALSAFQFSNVPGVWIGSDFTKAKILATMRTRLQKPWTFDQSSVPFCGPSAIVYCLITKKPLTYISIMRNLFERGFFNTPKSGNLIRASRSLLEDSQNRESMAAADWMITSVLRDSEQAIFDVEPSDRDLELNIEGITYPWNMDKWTMELFNYADNKCNFVYFINSATVNDLRTYGNYLNRPGGIVYMLVSTKGLINFEEPTTYYPSHWIALYDNNIRFENNRIIYKVYTWGKIYEIKSKPSEFKRFVFGFGYGYQ